MIKKIVKKLKVKFFSKPQKIITYFFTKDFFLGKKYLIGDFTYGCPNVIFENNDANLCIGKFCSIAEHVTIFLGGNHRTDWVSTYPFNVLNDYFPDASSIKGHPATKGDVVIGNDVWIGRGAVIMSGVKIGNGAVVAAYALVTNDIGDYEIWGGNPAKLLKKRFDEETISKLQKLKWWDWEIKEIIENVEHLCSNNIDNLKSFEI
ncbi:CatB-related O-acetyltransferase [Flavobacterium laiguense]|uniref:Chloramphenicol acetyltransferase n=1 Tax=Flavobacterium laiguense TaxID=2169409 RepID=A0A2U1JXW0_9FLAO|nr:CatB-related O-acetyltransferase [Flavobacterium laiguense]PWA09992.1 chloramphenicol acetyltransferase [Flavobacterium laiguense]